MNLPVQYTPGSGLNSFAGKPDEFLRGEDTPSNYLDRCLDSINAQEPEVKAWVTTRLDAVRIEAEAADRGADARAKLPAWWLAGPYPSRAPVDSSQSP